MKQKELSILLRAVLVVALACLVLVVTLVVPLLISEGVKDEPELIPLVEPGIALFAATLLPVLLGIYNAWLVFADIGRDRSFTMKNAKRLRTISALALLDTVLYIVGLALLCLAGTLTPGLLLILLAIIIFGFAMTAAAAALSHLTQKAAVLRDENDLTI